MRKILSVFFLTAIIISACGPVTPAATPKPTISIAIPTLTVAPTVELYPGLESITPENINRLEEITHWGDGNIDGIAVSPDQKIIAIHNNREVSLLDSQSLETIKILSSEYNFNPKSIAFSPDGKQLAIANPNLIEIWDIGANKVISRFSLWVPDLQPSSIKYSPNGNFIVVHSSGGNAPCDGAAANNALYNIKGDLIFSRYSCHPFYYEELFTIDNRFLYVAYDLGENRAQLTTIDLSVDVPDKISFKILSPIFLNGINSFSPDGAFFTIYNYKTQKYEVIETSSSKVLAVLDGAIEFIQIENGKYTWKKINAQPQNETLPCNLDANHHKIIVKNGENAVVNSTNTFKLLNLLTCHTIKTIRFTASHKPIIFSPDGRVFAKWDEYHIDTMSTNNRLLLSKIAVDITETPIDAVSFNTNGSLIITGSITNLYETEPDHRNYRLAVWDANTGIKIKTLIPATTSLFDIIPSPDKNIIIVSDLAGFSFWDIQKGSLLHTIPTSILDFQTNGNLVAADFSEKIELFDFRTGKRLRTITLPNHRIEKLFFSQDGSKLVIETYKKSLRKAMITTLNTNNGKIIYQVALDDFRTIIAGNNNTSFALYRNYGRNDAIQIWDFEHDKPILSLVSARPIKGIEKTQCLCFSSSVDAAMFNMTGQVILSLEKNKMRFWDAQNGMLLDEIVPNFTIYYRSVDFSPDGYFIFIVDNNGILHIWGVPKR